ncbi:MAG: hypothetical protein QW530_01380 [Candidatus Micrarchaeaceae archaeon]
MMTKQIVGSIFIVIALIFFILSYTTYINSYHKATSNISNFGFLFSGIFWSFVDIVIGAIFLAIGLIWAYPKGAKWIAERGKNYNK